MIFSIDLVQYEMQQLHFKVFLTIYMHQFGWLSEREGNFLNLLQKDGLPRQGGFPHKGGGVGWVGSNPEGNYGLYYFSKKNTKIIAIKF